MTTIVANNHFLESPLINTGGTVAAIARLNSGGFVLIGYGSGARFAQIYDASGHKVGPATQVAAGADLVGVTGLASGGFAIAWTTQALSNYTINTQAFDAAGSALGSATEIEKGRVLENLPSLVALSNGNYTVSWQQKTVSDPGTWPTYIRTFDANGSPLSAPAVVSQTYTSQSSAALADGHVVMAYTTGASSTIVLRDYDPATGSIASTPWPASRPRAAGS